MRTGLAFCLAMLLAACTVTGSATDGGSPSPTSTPSPSSSPTVELMPSPSPSPTRSPTPTPDPAAMTLRATSCNGGVMLRWSASLHPDFHHYIGLRSPDREIAPQYPPIAPAVDWGDLYATDRFVTSGFDATVVPSDTEWQYRVVAYDVSGRVVSRSEVASGRILPYRDLGPITAEIGADGRVRLGWKAFDGVPECFSAYRVLYGTGGTPATLLTSISDPERTDFETDALHPGLAYTLRVQAVRTTTLGQFVVGESDVLTHLVSAQP